MVAYRESESGSRQLILLTAACVVTVVVMALSVWAGYDASRKFSAVSATGLEMQNLRGQILRYDEILTMSTRMAAATGDPRWEARYRETEPRLAEALEQAKRLIPDFRTTGQTNASNDALVTLEEQALELALASRNQEATAILDGQEYTDQKAVYAEGMRQLGEQLETVARSTARSLQERAWLQVIGSLIALPLLIVGWWIVLRVANRWRREIAASHEQLLQLNQNLDCKVRDRTAELAKATENAQAANKAKSTFMANMSHELRTPMNAIIGYSEMLIEELEDTDQEDLVPDLKKINAAGQHLLGLINDVLDISKIEAGRMELYLEAFDIGTLVRNVATTVQPLIETNENTLEVRCPDDLGSMRADATKLRQALLNVLSNAAKFTHQGSITLEVSRTPDGDFVRFEIADTGIGIPEDRLDSVFDEFSQADESTTRNYGGTGLGLPISRHFCRMMEGDLTVASTPGKGSTFTIEVPARVNDGNADEGRDDAMPAGEGPLVLVIDDDPVARDLIGRTVRGGGFSVVTASGGEDGLRKARELEPVAITLDVLMPGTDGWSVLTSLKAEPELQDIPVIMVSILGEDRLAQALGASDFVTKPVDRERLVRILRRYLPSRHSGRIMIVDDEPAALEMLVQLVEKEGWATVTAENGRDALDKLAEADPALILTDLMMPEMDGFEFIDALRSHEAWRRLPVVVLTAKDLTEADRQRLSGQVERVLNKGAEATGDLLEKLRELVDGAQPAWRKES